MSDIVERLRADLAEDRSGKMKQDDYYISLKRRAESTHGDNVPLTDKERNDLRLLEIAKHYEQVLIHKMALRRLEQA
jgi:hypothetical protein